MKKNHSKGQFPYDATPMEHDFPGMPANCFDLVNRYGTYNIQKTADTDNEYPAIAQKDAPEKEPPKGNHEH